MSVKEEASREVNKAKITAVFEHMCDKMKIDRSTLYGMVSEIMEEDGYCEIEHTQATLH